MTRPPIIYSCITTALFFLCFHHHDELGTTKQALPAMPNGLHQGLGGVPFSEGLGPFPQDNWHFCWKVKQYIPPGSSRQSFVGCLAQRCPLSAPELGWLGRPLLGAGADQVLTRAGSNPTSSIEKKLVCSLNILCLLSVFTRVRKRTHGYISF